MKRSVLVLALVLFCATGQAFAAGHGGGGGGGHGGMGGGMGGAMGGGHGWGGHGWHGGWHGGHHHGGDFVFGFGFAPWYWDPFYFPYAYSYPYPYYAGYGYPPPPEDAGPPPDMPPPDQQQPDQQQQQDAWNGQQDNGDPMDASYGLVKLRGVPDGASVELDGRYWLTAARLSERWLALPRGRHTLTIRPQQGAASEHTVDIKPGVNVVIDFHMRG